MKDLNSIYMHAVSVYYCCIALYTAKPHKSSHYWATIITARHINKTAEFSSKKKKKFC